VELPAGLTARDLIWIHAATRRGADPAVNLTLSVLTAPVTLPTAAARAGLGRVIDRHGQGAPQDVGMLFRFPTTQAERLLVQASDRCSSHPAQLRHSPP